MENGTPLDKLGAYLKTFQRDIHLKEGLLFNDNTLIVPEALSFIFMSFFTRNTPRTVRHGGIGRKNLVADLYREIYYHGKNCSQYLRTGRNLKFVFGFGKHVETTGT